jgi:hypothetical protein
LSFILDQLIRVFWFLVFERHRMKDALGIMRGSVAGRLLREFFERARSRNERIHEIASHAARNSSEGADGNTVFCLGLFELLDGLSGCVHYLADLALAKANGFAHRGDPAA